MPLPGRSPGHVCVEIDSVGQRAVLGGDVIHAPIQCRHPEWHSGPDMDEPAAARTRTAFLERYCEAGTLVCMTHFPLPSAGYIRRVGAAFPSEFDTVVW